MIFSNGPEYEARRKKDFTPPDLTLKDIHDAVPKHLLKRDPWKSALYIAHDVALAALLFAAARRMDTAGPALAGWLGLRSALGLGLVRCVLWAGYWWFQGLVWAGIFCLGHDAGHGTLFESSKVNNTTGYILHTFLLIPYFAWRATHHAHHKATGSMERDENYVPHTRADLHLPAQHLARQFDYAEVFEETPLWTLVRVAVMQGMGWWLYLGFNTLGSKMYPRGTNHFQPSSPLFKKEQRPYIFITNMGLVAMMALLAVLTHRFGVAALAKHYLVPYILTNHWIVMFTYLHHSDPTIPHYRKEAWSFLRGAAATVDRPLLGWMGRVFLHNISHDHVAHHFFSHVPFYNGPEITKALRGVLCEHYNYDSTNTAYALWRSFTQCLFVEADEPIVFYKNKHGVAVRRVAGCGGEGEGSG